MDQLEQDQEIVEFCKKSLSYRKQLSGEEHEVLWHRGPVSRKSRNFSGVFRVT